MAAQICETCKKKGNRCYCAPNSTCETYEPKILTHFEEFKAMTIEQFAEWLDKYGQFDGSPWMIWFDENYCSKCPSEQGYLPDYTGKHTWNVPTEFAWCELHDKCKFFQEMDATPSSKEVVKMWLESEVKI